MLCFVTRNGHSRAGFLFCRSDCKKNCSRYWLQIVRFINILEKECYSQGEHA